MTPPRSSRWPCLLASALLILLVACTSGSDDSTQPTPASPGTSSGTTGGCRLQADADVNGVHGNEFAGVTAGSPDDVWAVGSHFEVSKSGPLAQHWNGSAWQTILQGGQRFGRLQLTDAIPLGADGAWVVGFTATGAGSLKWDGASWTEVPGASGLTGAVFLGVDAVSPTDLWVVGKASASGGYDIPIAQRSRGSSWTTVAVPMPPGIAAGLRDVVVTGKSSAWAVGWSVDNDKLFRPLVERWDGERWTVHPTPRPPGDALLSGVAATGPNDVWTVGWSWEGDATTSLVLHWDGTRWSRVALSGDGATAKLASVTAEGDEVVAGGQALDANGILQPVVLGFDGSGWTDHAASVDTGGGDVEGVALIGNRGMIAVGSQIGADGYASLVQSGC
jgi:hypothetical protein